MRTFRKSGFTLLEILVALAIMAVLAAVVYPAVNGKLRDARTATLAQTLLGLSQSIAEFKRATTMYPSNLSQLTTAPVAASSLNICGTGNTFTTAAAALWRGPYTSREVTTNGVPAGDVTINAGLRRLVSGSSTFLLIDVPAVEQTIADDLESQFDGTANAATGSIRTQTGSIASTTTSSFVPATSSPYTNLSFSIPINSC